MSNSFFTSMEPKSLVSLIKYFSKATDYELPAFGLLLLAIIPGFLDEVFAMAAIGVSAIAIRLIREHLNTNKDEILVRLEDGLNTKQISEDDFVSSVRLLNRATVSKSRT